MYAAMIAAAAFVSFNARLLAERLTEVYYMPSEIMGFFLSCTVRKYACHPTTHSQGGHH
jgi:hypothetical protein